MTPGPVFQEVVPTSHENPSPGVSQEWARSQLSAVEAKAAMRLSPEQFPEAAREAKASAQWGCPKCRQPYPSAALPSSYLCYCGKLTNPEWDPW